MLAPMTPGPASEVLLLMYSAPLMMTDAGKAPPTSATEGAVLEGWGTVLSLLCSLGAVSYCST